MEILTIITNIITKPILFLGEQLRVRPFITFGFFGIIYLSIDFVKRNKESYIYKVYTTLYKPLNSIYTKYIYNK